MANRFFDNRQYALDKGTVELNGIVNVGAAGVPTMQRWTPSSGGGGAYSAILTGGFRGFKSISRSSTGTYVLVLQDTYQRLMNYNIVFQAPTTSTPAAPIATITTTGTNVQSASSPQVTFVCQSSAGVAADPASGEIMMIYLKLQNSTAQ